ncbi:ATP phosphoribosyltransferase [Corallococcus sp. H22C18031201]|uniref:ATP phosphoribosyltransferase n=1 Tax=Citreicoccus inhibens TaxID=2849499 RepID=UPI000E730530|nr:ATP phosphoribosyltransferase [Citreicoccus inhibens]MBU8898554.1 ATP phosphoribosyltransferase [Citreicoccus inhibens]RJS24980.1 ATP phosphoribosyltransferase [Corallococcus sp. H22C18031201]
MLKIALPNKGRLSEEIRELFHDAGLEVRARGARALSASLGGQFEALFVRAQDIPEFVADGAAHAGVTGWDLVSEAGRPVELLRDLEFGRCRLVVAAREDSGIATEADVADGMRVASCFPRLTQAHFEKVGRNVTVVPVSGAAEISPRLGIADLVVDLTSTGSTLRMNGLREVSTVLESSARLVACHGNDADARLALDEMSRALGSVIAARGRRYLMANVPKLELGRVREVLPGLNGPTVVDVLDGGRFVAVHAVVLARTLDATIRALKALGCEGILVTRIERLMA